MAKLQKSVYIFLVLLLQIILAVSGGLLVLYFTARDTISPNTYIGTVNVGTIHREEALKKTADYYEKDMADGSLTIRFNNNGEFKIKYGEIDAAIDYKASVDSISGGRVGEAFLNLVNGKLLSKKKEVPLVVTVNEGKLRKKLEELSTLIDTEPANADIFIKDGNVLKIAEVSGMKLNIDNAVRRITGEIKKSIDSIIEFKPSDNYEIQVVAPKYTLKDLEGADEIIAQYSTDINSVDAEDSIRLAASAINKVLIRPADVKQGEEAGVFSFNKYLAEADGVVERNNEGYNQVASTLYSAVMIAGIKQDAVTRTPHKTPVDYIDPGLDAVVFGNSVNFTFKNTLDCPVVIFAEVKANKVTVSLVGKKKDKSQTSSLRIETEQKFDPPVINVENQDLKPGEKKLVSPGKEGVKVNVYRVALKDGNETDKQLLHADKYDAVEAIIQIGPHTQWDSIPSK